MGLIFDDMDAPAILNELRSGAHIFGEMMLIQPKYARMIVEHLNEGRISHQNMRAAIHEGILRCGRQCFNDHVRLSIPPTHTYSPEAIGYACLHNEITEEEASKINFPYGGSLGEYMKYGFFLLDRLEEHIRMKAKMPDKICW